MIATMKRSLLILSLCLACTAAFGQSPAKLSRAQAVADIDTMAYLITTIHPDPFTIIPESDFRTGIERVKASLPDSVKTLDLYLQLAPIVASLGDGHTSLQAPGPIFGWLDGARWFPLPLEVDPDTFEMTSDGRQVAQINGIPTAEIVRKVLAAQSGESMAFKIAGVQEWPIWVSALYSAESYAVAFDDGGTVEADGITIEKFAELPDVQNTGIRPPYAYDLVDDKNTAILEFNAFRDEERFAAFLDSMFTDLNGRGTSNLIIDLRANGGGNSNLGDELLRYISPAPFKQYGPTTIRFSEPVRKLYPDRYASMQDTIFVSHNEELIQPYADTLRFRGNVYVLTSPRTFSSATDFAWAFQYFDMGTIVGSDTGGYAVCFGDSIRAMLSYSRMLLSVSWKEFYGYGATEADRRPVRPDIEVPAAEALDYVLENLIK